MTKDEATTLMEDSARGNSAQMVAVNRRALAIAMGVEPADEPAGEGE